VKNPPDVKLAVDGGRVVLTGSVPSEAARTALVDAAKAAIGEAADQLTVDANVTDAGLAGLGGVLTALGKESKGVVVQLRGGTITLSGTVPAQAVKDAVVRAAAARWATPRRSSTSCR
jgi:osmotically-inducible protein OsmY